jgi:ferric enterobactin receptor
VQGRSNNHPPFILFAVKYNLTLLFHNSKLLQYLKRDLQKPIFEMKRTMVLTIFLLLVIIAKAQTGADNTITGTIIDSASHLPLEYATISLFKKQSTKPVTGTVTDKKGHFVVTDIKDGVYRIEFEFIGYKSFVIKDVQLNKTNSRVYVKTISLDPQKTNLQSVTVVAQNKLVENKIDKLVYNAEKDISSQSGVATDVLKKVPQVSIDVDGNVELAGSGGIRFLINGKPSTAFGSSITDVLQSIPASQIKSIEVITNPGAKYDAQGLGGIINIILKTNTAKGYNGNLSLTAGTRNENGSFNLNARNKNFGVNAFVSGNKRLTSTIPSSSDRLTQDSLSSNTLHQEGVGQFERHGLQAGTGFDWTYKKYNSFSGSVSYNDFGNTGNGRTNQALYSDKVGSPPAILSLINSNYISTFKNVDAGLNYKRTFAKEDQELEIGVNTSSGNNKNTSANAQSFLPQDSLFYGRRSTNPGKTDETEIKIDYTQPIKKDVTLGVGSKASFYNINSTSNVDGYQPGLKAYQPNPSLSNDLKYHQKVYALYSELSFPVANLLQAKIGGRYERTEINSYYSNAQQQAKVPGYNTFVPSIFLSKKIGELHTIKLSYSKRIERPDYQALNPFVNTNDPKNLTAGNPNLQPEIGHRYELSYTRDLGKTGSVMVNLFYRVNEHDIQPYLVYYPSYTVGDTTYTNVTVSTRQNIGMEQNLGMNLFGDVHINSKLGLRSNVFLFRRHTINTLDQGYDYNSFNYRVNLNANYQFTKTLVAEFFGNFNSPRHEAQGRYPSFTTYSFAMRKQFWKKKGSLALTANNFMQEYVNQKTMLFGPGFSVNGLRQIPFRSIGINFTWKFGKLEFKKEKSEYEAPAAVE